MHIQALSALAKTLWLHGEYERATALMEECLTHCCAEGLTLHIRTSLQLLGHITWAKGDYAHAMAVYRELLGLAQEAGDAQDVLRALMGLGDVARGLGDAAQVEVLCEESLRLSREAGDRELEGFALHTLGVAAWLQRDLPRAGALLARSEALFRERKAPTGVAEVLTSVGRLARTQGQLEQARSAFIERLRLAQPTGPFFLLPDNLDELAGLAAAQALRSAKRMLPSALRQARFAGDLAEAQAQLGDTAFEAAYRAGQALRVEEAIALETSSSAVPAR